MGRPAKWAGEGVKAYSLKVPPSLNAEIEAAAADVNLAKSDWIRLTIRNALSAGQDAGRGRLLAAYDACQPKVQGLIVFMCEKLAQLDAEGRAEIDEIITGMASDGQAGAGA